MTLYRDEPYFDNEDEDEDAEENPLDQPHPYPGDEGFQEWYEGLSADDQQEFDDEQPADLGDDMPEWWDQTMPDDWLTMIHEGGWDDYEYEEFEIGIDYGEDT